MLLTTIFFCEMSGGCGQQLTIVAIVHQVLVLSFTITFIDCSA